jgi:hypothetical protein
MSIQTPHIQAFVNSPASGILNKKKLVEDYYTMLPLRSMSDNSDNFHLYLNGYLDGHVEGYDKGLKTKDDM